MKDRLRVLRVKIVCPLLSVGVRVSFRAMKGLLLAIMTVLVQPCSGGDHLITENRPAAEDSPLEFTNIIRGKRTAFVLSYLPSKTRGRLGFIIIFLKEKRRGEETFAAWLSSPTVRHIDVTDKDEPISRIFSFSDDEIARMIACVYYKEGGTVEEYFYPLAEIIKNEPSPKVVVR